MHLDIRAVICDMDGLLLDSENLFKKSWQEAALTLGHEMPDAIFLQLVGRSAVDSRRILAEAFGGTFPYDDFKAEGARVAQRMICSGPIPLKPGAVELLQWCRKKKLPTAVATSTEAGEARRRLEAAGLLSYFDALIGGNEVAYGKPAPEIYVHAAGALGISPFFCLAIEDSHAGVESAFAADMITFMVPDLMPVTPVMEEMADGIFPSLHEVLARLKKELGE